MGGCQRWGKACFQGSTQIPSWHVIDMPWLSGTLLLSSCTALSALVKRPFYFAQTEEGLIYFVKSSEDFLPPMSQIPSFYYLQHIWHQPLLLKFHICGVWVSFDAFLFWIHFTFSPFRFSFLPWLSLPLYCTHYPALMLTNCPLLPASPSSQMYVLIYWRANLFSKALGKLGEKVRVRK